MATFQLPKHFGKYFAAILPATGRSPQALIDRIYQCVDADGASMGSAIVRDVQMVRGYNIPDLVRRLAGVPGGELEPNQWYELLTMQWVEPKAATESFHFEMIGADNQPKAAGSFKINNN